MPCLTSSSQHGWVRHSALGVCSVKQNLDSTVDWKLIPLWASARSVCGLDLYCILRICTFYVREEGFNEESGGCRTAHFSPTSSQCPRAAEPCCAAFEPQGGTKWKRPPSGVTPSSSSPWVSAELLLFTTRYAVIRLRSRECVASLLPSQCNIIWEVARQVFSAFLQQLTKTPWFFSPLTPALLFALHLH